MSITFNDTVTKQGLVQDIRFTTGLDNLSIEDATRASNFALDRYTHLAFQASGRWKYDDSTNTGRTRATSVLDIGDNVIPMDATHLIIDEVEVYYDGHWCVISPVDASRDNAGVPLDEQYSTNGRPEVYDINGKDMQLYPATDKEATVRVWYSRASNHFATTDTTRAIGIPSIHQDFLSLFASERIMLRTNDAILPAIRDARMKKEAEIKEFFGLREMNTPQSLVGNVNVPE